MKIKLNESNSIAIKTSDLDIFKNCGKDNKYFKAELINSTGEMTTPGALEPCYGLKLDDGDQLSFIFWPDNPQEMGMPFMPFNYHRIESFEDNTSKEPVDVWGYDSKGVDSNGLYIENGKYYLQKDCFDSAIEHIVNAIYMVEDNNGDRFLIKIEHKDMTTRAAPLGTVSIIQMPVGKAEDFNTKSYISNRKTFEVSRQTSQFDFTLSEEEAESPTLVTCYVLNEITPLLPTEAKSGDGLEIIKSTIADHETRISALESASVSKDEEADLSYLFEEDSSRFTIGELE